MKNICLHIVTCIFFFSSCNKENKKSCWRGYDGMLVQTGVFCDKTKEEALRMPYTAFVCTADEMKYCWALSNGVHYTCIPQTIMDDFCRPQGLTYTKENCTGTCRYKALDKNDCNLTILYVGNWAISKWGFAKPPLLRLYKKINLL